MIKRTHRGQARGGFTLMEMMVVVAIIVVLVAVAVPMFMGRLDEAKVSAARASIESITQAAQMYKLKYGDYPPNLVALTQPGADGTAPFIELKHLTDPWQRPYEYDPRGPHNVIYSKPDVWSNGPRPGDPTSIVGNW